MAFENENNSRDKEQVSFGVEEQIRLSELKKKAASDILLSENEAQELNDLRNRREQAIHEKSEKRLKEILNTAPEKTLKSLQNMSEEKRAKSLDLESLRFASKGVLRNLAGIYWTELGNMISRIEENRDIDEAQKQKQIENIVMLRGLMSKVAQYSNMDVNAVKGDLDKEIDTYKQILSGLNDLDDTLAGELTDSGEMDELHKMTVNMLNYFQGQMDGNLIIEENSIEKNMVGKEIKGNLLDYNVNNRDVPLFPHDPTYRDILQAELGDCYLISALSAVALRNADKIKEAMRDNGDGTATVRFWKREKGKDGKGVGDTFKPVYVTVDKVTPADGSAQDCCWVQTIERAYAASGLYLSSRHFSLDTRRYSSPAPDSDFLEKEYKRLKALDRSEWPSPAENPWLIDAKGNLCHYKPSYDDIDGGDSGSFIEAFLGPGYDEVSLQTEELAKYNEKTPSMEVSLKIHFNMLRSGFPQADEDILSDIESDLWRDVSEADFFYKMVTGDINASMPLNKDGEPDTSVGENEKIAEALVYIIGKHEKNCTARANNKNGSGLDHTGLPETVEGLINSKEYDIDEKHVDALAEIAANEKTREKFENCLKMYEKHSKEMLNDYRTCERYSGEYNGMTMKYLDKIETALKDGYPVTFGTKSAFLGDILWNKGMHYQHAYTVTGVDRRTVNGKTHVFLKFRNPHGGIARSYKDTDVGGLKKNTVFFSDKGEGEIELTDAMRELSRIMINGPVKGENIVREKVKEPISTDTISKYWRALESIKKEFDTSNIGSNNSNQYKFLKKYMEVTMKKILTFDGKDMSRLHRSMTNCFRAVKKYEDHCVRHPKTGSVREARLRACDSFKKLYEMSKRRETDPRGITLNSIAEKVTRHFLTISPESSGMEISNKQFHAYAEQMKSTEAFQTAFGKTGFSELAHLNERGTEALIERFRSTKQKQVGNDAAENVKTDIARQNTEKQSSKNQEKDKGFQLG